MRTIPVTDPHLQNETIKDDLRAAFERVLHSDSLILGREVESLELEFAELSGVSNCVGVANGTDAIALSLRALGIGAGDEVITASHTAVATVAGIDMCGATPVLVDVDPRTYTIDPSAVAAAVGANTAAILPVHLYGQPADMATLTPIAVRHGLAVVEDCSQAHGARSTGGVVGSLGNAGCFSCYPTKNLGALGDAGLITTDDAALAARIRALRQYGWRERNFSTECGVNSRLDELQAGFLRVKMGHLGRWNLARQEVAASYIRELAVPASAIQPDRLQLPELIPGTEHVFHLFVVQSVDRERFRTHLRSHGVTTALHYPLPVHRQPAYADRLRLVPDGLPVTEALAPRIVTLPLFPEMDADSVQTVINAVQSAFTGP